jgi:hypothetical protein
MLVLLNEGAVLILSEEPLKLSLAIRGELRGDINYGVDEYSISIVLA